MSKQLCWSCAKACGGCSWSEYGRNEPVPGWTARPTVLPPGPDGGERILSYQITACPQFVLDREAEDRGCGKESKLDREAVWRMICAGMTNKEIAQVFDVPVSTAGGWRRRLKQERSAAWETMKPHSRPER